jgi:cbb3-type cytochrome oxidase cytochrome c subunit
MNYGAILFLAAFFALASSWCGFVLAPLVQVGRFQQTNSAPAGVTYPVARPGLARQGLDVYRANGCAYCHSQQVVQSGTVCDVVLGEPGTNQAATLTALLKLRPDWTDTQAREAIFSVPKPVLQGVTKEQAEAAVKALNGTSAKSSLWIIPEGPDIARGWGKRRTVAEDFLFDDPALPGSMRIGPDLANVGVRQPDLNWHLRHLYAPQTEVKGSTMPRYKFLFEKRRIDRFRSPEALALAADVAPEAGFEILPTPEARALAAYLASLRADAPLFVAPLTAPPAAPVSTNAPSPTASAK